MPFAVLLEVALQVCGWLAAYVGSALTSDNDLRFRNLGGNATQFADPSARTAGTLMTRVEDDQRFASSAGMIIQHYDFEVSTADGGRCTEAHVFRFLSRRVAGPAGGHPRSEAVRADAGGESPRARAFAYPDRAAVSGRRCCAWSTALKLFVPDGGPNGLGLRPRIARPSIRRSGSSRPTSPGPGVARLAGAGSVPPVAEICRREAVGDVRRRPQWQMHGAGTEAFVGLSRPGRPRRQSQ